MINIDIYYTIRLDNKLINMYRNQKNLDDSVFRTQKTKLNKSVGMIKKETTNNQLLTKSLEIPKPWHITSSEVRLNTSVATRGIIKSLNPEYVKPKVSLYQPRSIESAKILEKNIPTEDFNLIFKQDYLNNYVLKFNMFSEYQNIDSKYISEFLNTRNIFLFNDQDLCFSQEFEDNLKMITCLIWSSSAQKSCIASMNDGKWKIDLIKIGDALLNVKYCKYYVYLISILKFVGQFTTNSIYYNFCIKIIDQLENSQNLIHLIAFNKKFRPVHTLIPEKISPMNRIMSFNFAKNSNSDHQLMTKTEHVIFYENRIKYIYNNISEIKNCNVSMLKAKYIYLLNSLIEYERIKALNKGDSHDPRSNYFIGIETLINEINLKDLFRTLTDILKEIQSDQDNYNNICHGIFRMVRSINQNKINTPESDIIQKNKINIPHFAIIDLLDTDSYADNEMEIYYIISEIYVHVTDSDFSNYENQCQFNKELIDAFVFISDKKLISKKNFSYLKMLYALGGQNWIRNIVGALPSDGIFPK